MALNPNEVLDAGISKRGATGQRELIPAGTYEGCEISEVTPLELNQKDIENGNEARLKITFVCRSKKGAPTFDRYLNVKQGKLQNPHPLSTHFKIMAALWPEVEDRVNKSFRDWVGEQVTVNVFHVTNEQGSLIEDVVFSPFEEDKE